MGQQSITSLLLDFLIKGYLDKDLLQKYHTKNNSKNLRNCLEDLFTKSSKDLESVAYQILDSWSDCDDIWNKNEILVFRYLLRNKGVATLLDLKKTSKLDIKKIRDAVVGLEEEETNPIPILISIKWNGNSKLVFISPYYIEHLLNKNGNRE